MSRTLDNKLHAAIDVLNDTQKKAVLGIVTVMAEHSGAHWEDEEFLSEMEDRLNEYKSGEVRAISLDMAESNARKAARKIVR